MPQNVEIGRDYPKSNGTHVMSVQGRSEPAAQHVQEGAKDHVHPVRLHTRTRHTAGSDCEHKLGYTRAVQVRETLYISATSGAVPAGRGEQTAFMPQQPVARDTAASAPGDPARMRVARTEASRSRSPQ